MFVLHAHQVFVATLRHEVFPDDEGDLRGVIGHLHPDRAGRQTPSGHRQGSDPQLAVRPLRVHPLWRAHSASITIKLEHMITEMHVYE